MMSSLYLLTVLCLFCGRLESVCCGDVICLILFELEIGDVHRDTFPVGIIERFMENGSGRPRTAAIAAKFQWAVIWMSLSVFDEFVEFEIVWKGELWNIGIMHKSHWNIRGKSECSRILEKPISVMLWSEWVVNGIMLECWRDYGGNLWQFPCISGSFGWLLVSQRVYKGLWRRGKKWQKSILKSIFNDLWCV